MKIFESLRIRLLISMFIVILYFGIALDFSLSKLFISHVDEATSFSSDFKRLVIYFLLIFLSFIFLNKKYRFFVFPFYLVWTIQFLNFSNTGVFLSPLTIENLGEYSSIGLGLILKFVYLFILSLALFVYLLVVMPKIRLSWNWKISVSAFLFLTLFIFFSVRSSYPVAQFVNSFYIVYLNNYAEIERNNGEHFLKRFVNTFNAKGIENPINPKNEKLNLIIIFTEGLSDRVISEALTPNLYKLRQNSLYFENYYNHTAPTFRGLRGQLISGFVRAANSDVNTMSQRRLELTFKNSSESLPSIFNDNHYDTVFLGPHQSDDKLYLYMKVTGFRNIRSSNDFHTSNEHNSELTDHDIFNFLAEIIDEEMRNDNHFFISMYNGETHHGMIVKEHIYGDGVNDYFNKFHNFDFCLGKFIERFNESKVSDNTVLVITTDHSTYAVPLFEDSFRFKTNTRSLFVDKIPFIVYKKGVTVNPLIFNAHGRNSLCLAPTLLDLMGMDGIKHHFLGTSLFDENDSELEHLSIIGADSVETSENEYHDTKIREDHERLLKDFWGFSG
ncbi:Phosphoglycerol transferase MdoB [Succinivibrio dextrinosolvens DSM 3072]|uniref:Phosphoglycerol transferase MdoB n=1 Tax=Succinivibrio dextrinosolvens DSM 3072 TaxID=1123324 RepID=A0A1T4VBH9_9GAMM|nr:sulfatase-like hydrolase/transferase [Succinivibrio dextrinosolvens]SKA62322.1 Phosphoglycerol transferase MdoB [Succinivibrio dextrinosolvens DSM 3072]